MSQRVVVGIDIGGGHLSAGVFALQDRRLLGEEEAPNRADSLPSLVGLLVDMVSRLVGAAGSEMRVEAVGVGVPGQVFGGVLVAASNLPDLRAADIAGEVGRRLGVPARLYNDANCAVCAEVLDSSERTRTAAMLTLGTGVGLGLFLDGQPYTGGRGMVEGGHSILVPGGRR